MIYSGSNWLAIWLIEIIFFYFRPTEEVSSVLLSVHGGVEE